jgi:hypothetical protein
MKKFLQWFLIVVAIIIAIFVIGGLLLPSTWSVTESTTISAPKERVYEQIANLRNWQNWSPWTKESDPSQVYVYEGPEAGEGAKWLWTSEKMGKGHLLIKDADVNKGVSYELFIDMHDSKSTIDGSILYSEANDALNVVWTDKGDSGNDLLKRWFTLGIKYMLSNEMKSGLAKLKKITEAQ